MSAKDEFDFEDVVGAWTLKSAVARDANGRSWWPFGEEPEGVLLYTPDRWVSATITSVGTEQAPGQCFYAGPVVVSGADLEHRVVVGKPPFGPGTVQMRRARIIGGELELTAQTTGPVSVTTLLTWRRLNRPGSRGASIRPGAIHRM